jgi:2,4-dienoyl-CoA reductase-like NADH-dependent reductase (Old Yellow Enzyme family)
MTKYRRVAQLRSPQIFREYLAEIGADIPFDEEIVSGTEAPLGQPYQLPDGFTIGNRFCIHPMEGWDGTDDGKPTDLVTRRWTRFGESGAKLIWGGEAVAVRHDGRANPRQLMISAENLPLLGELRERLVEAHEAKHGDSSDLLVGLQLTHSGRFCRPNENKLEPIILYRHPYLDAKFNLPDDYPVMTDAEIEELIGQFVDAAEMAYSVGFQFMDIKHCHGYLGHEFLSAHSRPGPYGGPFENRTRFLREIVAGIRERVPGARIGVRLSTFDMPPFKTDSEAGMGIPIELEEEYPYAFGADHQNPLRYNLEETVRFLELLPELDVHMVNLSCGSPYYVPHIMRPALFPPSDGYLPPEDPLVGVARQLEVAAELKQKAPSDLLTVGTSYTYLQEWLPNVAQYQVRNNLIDFVGLGRMVLAYHDMPADVLAGRELARKRICRTFSDCTTAPRHGMVSGCYPLDPFYKERPEAAKVTEIKKAIRMGE